MFLLMISELIVNEYWVLSDNIDVKVVQFIIGLMILMSSFTIR